MRQLVLDLVYWTIPMRAAKIARATLLALNSIWFSATWPIGGRELLEKDWYSRALRFTCMWAGHGSVPWYNPCGFEPDQHCMICGEDLS